MDIASDVRRALDRGCALWVAVSMKEESLMKTGTETAPFKLETKNAIDMNSR